MLDVKKKVCTHSDIILKQEVGDDLTACVLNLVL